MKFKKTINPRRPRIQRGVRGKRNGLKKYKRSLRFLGVNTAGLKSKFTSFKKVIHELKPSVFFAQETKFKEEGQIKLGDEYIVYEKVRKNERGGGGLAIGCLKELSPCWVSEGADNVEAISINIFLKNMKIRCCTAYGPQENDNVDKKDAFWEHLDREVFEAENTGSGFLLQFDGNLWAGEGIVPGDPRAQNRNGKLLKQFLDRNPRLSVVNSLPLCQGLVTRSRLKDGVLEESILDFFIVCSSVLPLITKMVIDESRNYILTNYKAAKVSGKAIDSDHFTVYLDLNMEITKERPERMEIFNFKDKKSQEAFKINTSETDEFTECFKGEDPLIQKIEKWRKVLNSHCSKAFRKIRIKDKKMKPINKKISSLIDKRNEIVKNGCVCEKSFERRKSINIHSKKHVHPSLVGKLLCEECGKCFTKMGKFKLHTKIHAGKKEELCELCGKTCNNHDHIENHVSQHRRRKENTCEKCDETILLKSIFKNHQRVHRVSKYKVCDICDRKIASINKAIAEKEALENRDQIIKQFKFFSEHPENIEMAKMWKILKQICPKEKPILPSAKRNHRGKIISSKKDIKMLLANEYKNYLI